MYRKKKNDLVKNTIFVTYPEPPQNTTVLLRGTDQQAFLFGVFIYHKTFYILFVSISLHVRSPRRSRCGTARSCSRPASAAGRATPFSARSPPCLPCRRACHPLRRTLKRRLPAGAATRRGCPGETRARRADTLSCAVSSTSSLCPSSSSSRGPGMYVVQHSCYVVTTGVLVLNMFLLLFASWGMLPSFLQSYWSLAL